MLLDHPIILKKSFPYRSSFSTDTSPFLVTADGNDTAWCAVLHHKGHLPNCDKWSLITYSVRDLISLPMQECRDVTDMMTFATKTKARLIGSFVWHRSERRQLGGRQLPTSPFRWLLSHANANDSHNFAGCQAADGGCWFWNDTNLLLTILVCSYKKGIKSLSQTLKGNYMYLCILQCECVSNC